MNELHSNNIADDRLNISTTTRQKDGRSGMYFLGSTP